MALNLGHIIRLTHTVRTDALVLTNPSSATLTILQPDGITATPTVTLPPAVTGILQVDFTPSQSGLHSAHWATTVPTTADDDVFVAEPPASMLVSVDEAIAHMRAAGVIDDDPDREQVQWLCMVASDAVDKDLNRALTRRTVVETFSGGGSALRLRSIPVLSITTVVESGITLTALDYVLDDSTDLLYRGSTTSERAWAWGRRNIVVTYVAGYPNPPRSVRHVALGTVQELWQTSQQSEHPLLDETVELAVQGAASALPGPLRGAYNKLRAAPGHA